MLSKINFSLRNNENLRHCNWLTYTDAANWTWKETSQASRTDLKSRKEDDEIYIYDEIGPSFVGFSAADLLAMLPRDNATQLTVHLNSPGGDVFEGVAIYNLLQQRGNVTIQIDGLAASIASVIAMAGDRIVIAEAGQLMIHNPWTVAMGEAETFRAIADTLDTVKNQIASVYAARTGIDIVEIATLMNRETYLSADDAEELGFVDFILANKKGPQQAITKVDYTLLKSKLALLASRVYKQ
jgi:ATP-dependent Clp endopeptidase proteolytic subunit ClpP